MKKAAVQAEFIMRIFQMTLWKLGGKESFFR